MPTHQKRFDAVICGAGIAGIAAAHALVQAGLKNVAIVDREPPLSLTSDKSTECYRNWWPGPGDAMVALMNRSIDLMDHHAHQSNNTFQMNQRGYVFATAREDMIDVFERQALEAEELGAGPLRKISNNADYAAAPAQGYDLGIDGADLILNRALINEHFAYLNPQTVAVLHARRCGALSAQQLGMYLLERARAAGATLVTGDVTDLETSGGRISGVVATTAAGTTRLASDTLVLSPGPYLGDQLGRLGISLPIQVEKHIKISMSDAKGVVPRDAPLIIWTDPVKLPWSEDERAALAADAATRYLVDTFPAGVHGRPVGAGDQVLMYWTYDCERADQPEFPLTWDPVLPEITLRGMAALVPGLKAYFEPMPKPFVDGGYYTKTPENRPLIGPLPVRGGFVCGAFSGFGIMAACGAGELVAEHVVNGELPHYASAFVPSRYEDPAYRKLLDDWDTSGQL